MRWGVVSAARGRHERVPVPRRRSLVLGRPSLPEDIIGFNFYGTCSMAPGGNPLPRYQDCAPVLLPSPTNKTAEVWNGPQACSDRRVEADHLVGGQCEQAEHRMAGDFCRAAHSDMARAELVLEARAGPLDGSADAVSDGSGIGMAGEAPPAFSRAGRPRGP